MIFDSKYAAYNLVVRNEERQWFPDGSSRVVRPQITADFSNGGANLGPEQQIEGQWYPLIQAGFIDTVAEQKRLGWSDDERSLVERSLLRLCPSSEHGEPNDLGFGDVDVHLPAKAVPPWPTYDTADPAKLVSMAVALGFVQEALIYEERTLAREAILEGLREKLADVQGAETLVA